VIPDLELDLLTTRVDAAVSRANCGDVAGGRDELLYGRDRAEAAQEDGEAWGEEFALHSERALERFARVYGKGRTRLKILRYNLSTCAPCRRFV
jgi:hypothetical protein